MTKSTTVTGKIKKGKTLVADLKPKPANDDRAIDYRFLEAVGEVMRRENFKNERHFLTVHKFNLSLFNKIRISIQHVQPTHIAELSRRYGINTNFIYTGQGDMFTNDGSHNAQFRMQKLPVIPMGAAASFVETYITAGLDFDMEQSQMVLAPIEGFPLGSMVAEVTGDSMEPQLKHGYLVVAVPVVREEWQWAQSGVYAFTYRQFFVIKRIIKNDIGLSGQLELHSDNPLHGSIVVPVDIISGIWRIDSILNVPVR